jgi:hypothetical protein
VSEFAVEFCWRRRHRVRNRARRRELYTGRPASDVVAVVHAGYSSGSTVAGLGANATFVDQHAPEDRPDGGFDDTILMDIPPSDDPPWPSGTAIATCFQSYFDAPSVTIHECQYDAYAGTLPVSAGGSCM